MERVVNINTFEEDGWITKSASFLSDNGEKLNYWFKVPTEYADWLTDRADPLIYALIFPMMRRGGSFKIFGAKASKSVIDNLAVFSRIWNKWRPEIYKNIKIIAEEVSDDYRPDNNDAIMSFSGGLDASYSLYKYKTGKDDRFKYNITHAVMFLGADIPLNEEEQYEIAFKSAKVMTDDVGVTLIPIKTNVREFEHDWSFEFMPAMVGGMCMFGKKFSNCIIANGDDALRYNKLAGSHIAADPWLSSDTMKVVSDGIEHNRTQRAGLVKDWLACLENLRVCWRNEDKSKNCGKCEKCIRTKLNFLVNGCEHLPSMPNDLTYEELKNLEIFSEVQLFYLKEIYEYAKDKDSLPSEYLNLLKKKIMKCEKGLKRKHHTIWWHIMHMKF